MTESDNGKEKRGLIIRFAVLQSEKNQIQDSAKKLNMTLSEFCRQAIFEKIRRKEHPEMFNQGNTSQLDAKFLENILLKMSDMTKKQDLILEKTNIMNEMNKLLEKIALYSEKQDFVKEKATIVNLLKSHSSLTQKQLIEMTNLNKDVVFQTLEELKSQLFAPLDKLLSLGYLYMYLELEVRIYYRD